MAHPFVCFFFLHFPGWPINLTPFYDIQPHHSCHCFLTLRGNCWLFWPKGYLRFIDLLFPSVATRVMPPKGFIDGPVCSDASAVATAWTGLVKVQERARVLKHLVVAKGGSEDTDGKTVLPTRENMIHNAELLEALAANMNQRGRCGADPIDVICSMTVKFYEMHPLYTEVNKDFNLKAVSYNNAWVLHKMVSRLRSSLPKYQSSRDPCLFCDSKFSSKMSLIMLKSHETTTFYFWRTPSKERISPEDSSWRLPHTCSRPFSSTLVSPRTQS